MFPPNLQTCSEAAGCKALCSRPAAFDRDKEHNLLRAHLKRSSKRRLLPQLSQQTGRSIAQRRNTTQ
jgi:hypothetical protein